MLQFGAFKWGGLGQLRSEVPSWLLASSRLKEAVIKPRAVRWMRPLADQRLVSAAGAPALEHVAAKPCAATPFPRAGSLEKTSKRRTRSGVRLLLSGRRAAEASDGRCE